MQCPVEGCNNKHLYSTIGHLANHMVACHKSSYSSKVDAKRAATTLVQQYLTELASEDSKFLSNDKDESEGDWEAYILANDSFDQNSNTEEADLEVNTFRTIESSQNAESKIGVSKTISSRTAAQKSNRKRCKCLVGFLNQRCKERLCAKCCSGCNVHSKEETPSKVKKMDITQFECKKVLIADFETADASTKGITDACVYDLDSLSYFDQGGELVIPRVPVNENIVRAMKGSYHQ